MFFKRPAHNVFNYQPIFYDEQKERAEKRKKELEANKGNPKYASRIKGEFKRQFAHSAQKKQRNSSIRLLILIAFFGLVAYYLLIHKDLISYMLNYLIPEIQ